MSNQLKFNFSQLYDELSQSILNDITLTEDIEKECLDHDEIEYLSFVELTQILEDNTVAIKDYVIKHNKFAKNNKKIINELIDYVNQSKNLRLLSFFEKPAIGQQIVYIPYNKPLAFCFSDPVTIVKTQTMTYDVLYKKKKTEKIITINRDYLIFEILPPEALQIALFESQLSL